MLGQLRALPQGSSRTFWLPGDCRTRLPLLDRQLDDTSQQNICFVTETVFPLKAWPEGIFQAHQQNVFSRFVGFLFGIKSTMGEQS